MSVRWIGSRPRRQLRRRGARRCVLPTPGVVPAGVVAASSAGNASPITQLVVPKPAGAVAGNVLVAAVAMRPNNSVVCTPAEADWTLEIDQARSTSGHLQVYRRVIAPGDPASYTFDFDTLHTHVVGLIACEGIDTAAPVTQILGAQGSSSSSAVCPAVTTAEDGDLVLRFACGAVGAGGVSFTWPTSTEEFDQQSSGNGTGDCSGASRIHATAGDTGTETATLSQASIWAAVTFALKAGAPPSGGASESHAIRFEEDGVTPRQVFAPVSFVNEPLPDNALIDSAATASYVPDLVRQVGVADPYVNTWQYTAKIHVVPPDQPLVPVKLLGARSDTPFLKLKAMMATGLPIPPGWGPTGDSDDHGCFFQPDYQSPDLTPRPRYYEAWRLRVNGAADADQYPYTAEWGGRLYSLHVSTGHWVNWQTDGVESSNGNAGHPDSTWTAVTWGGTATSIPLLAGIITQEDMERGVIEHAVGLSVIIPAQGHRWPAQRNDGVTPAVSPIVEGARFRFPFDAVMPGGLHPVAQMIWTAVRDYGAVVWDKAGTLSFRAEPACGAFFDGTPGYDILDGFPWGDLVVLQTGSDSTPNPV